MFNNLMKISISLIAFSSFAIAEPQRVICKHPYAQGVGYTQFDITFDVEQKTAEVTKSKNDNGVEAGITTYASELQVFPSNYRVLWSARKSWGLDKYSFDIDRTNLFSNMAYYSKFGNISSSGDCQVSELKESKNLI